MKKYLVTGCAGFIGSHLSEELIHGGAKVIGIDNFDTFYSKKIKLSNIENLKQSSNFTFIEADIRNVKDIKEIFTNNQFDVVIHLAAKAGVLPSLENPMTYIETNISGTNNILEMMRLQKGKKNLVFASSSSIYGNNKSIPFKETDSVDHPISPYAFTKKSCELMNFSYHHLYNIDIINLRLFTVYGPRQRPDLAIRKFTELISNNKPVTMFGKGDTARDYTYIDDIISGFVSAINYIESKDYVYEIFNIGNHLPVKLSLLIDTLYKVIGKEKNIIQIPMQQGDVEITYADISKAQNVLNYYPQTSIEEGIRNFYNWYKQTN